MFDTYGSSGRKTIQPTPAMGAPAGAIDPMTGRPFAFGPTGTGTWGLQGAFGGTNNSENGGGSLDAFGAGGPVSGNYTPEFLQSLGYTGANPNTALAANDIAGGMDPSANAAFQKFLQDKGLRLGLSYTGETSPGAGYSPDQYLMRAFDAQNNPVGAEAQWRASPNEDAFALMLAAASAGVAGGAYAAGDAAMGAGDAGMGLAEGAYPASITGAGQGAVGGSMAGANGALLDPAAYSFAPGSITYPASTGALGGTTWGAGTGALETAGSLGGAAGAAGAAGGGATNAALIESAAGTPGYGASSAGLGGGAGDLAGITGPTAGGGSWLDTITNGLGGLKDYGSLVNTGGQLINGLIGSNAAGKAAGQISASADKANALLREMYYQTRSDQTPYRQTGEVGAAGMRNLLANPGSITQDPSYAFGLGQGIQGVDRSAAGRGGLYSGATLKALQRYGTDYAGTKLNDAFGRYGAAANLGEAATANTSAAGQNYGNQAGNNMTGVGSAQAGASLYGSNTWQNAINNGLANWNRSTYSQGGGG